MSKTKECWLVTHDHLEECDVNIMGPFNADVDYIAAQTKAGKTVPFRMYDDDDVLYHSGGMTEECFLNRPEAPLEDFGTPDSGAVRLDVRTDTKGWERLI